MRRIVLRLLLLAVFFNTALGMPRHEASHLHEATAAIQQGWSGLATHEDGEEAHGLCAWCLVHAHLATALRPSADLPAIPVERFVAPVVWPDAAFVPNPDRSPFASRDPPALT